MPDPQEPRPHGRTVYRWISGAFGLFLAATGLYILVFGSAAAIPRGVAGAVLLALGCNAVLCALRARRSWLSRIGPLP